MKREVDCLVLLLKTVTGNTSGVQELADSIGTKLAQALGVPIELLVPSEKQQIQNHRRLTNEMLLYEWHRLTYLLAGEKLRAQENLEHILMYKINSLMIRLK